MGKLEADYQAKLVRKLRKLYPDGMVFINDPTKLQGAPDILLLVGSKWFALEVKRSPHEPCRPNQEFYVAKMNAMSFAAFIFPENEREVLDAIQRSLGDSGSTFVS